MVLSRDGSGNRRISGQNRHFPNQNGPPNPCFLGLPVFQILAMSSDEFRM